MELFSSAWARYAVAGRPDAVSCACQRDDAAADAGKPSVAKIPQLYRAFPGVTELAKASLADVLREWSGLGYNRRAKFLHRAAQKAMTDFGGTIPSTHKALISLPGVGSNTAGAIRAYAFDQPAVFIETNIRTVFFHHFFADTVGVHDRELLPMVEQTLDREHPREWYWALMDYGAHLKQTQSSNISQSKHYVRQSKFEGSRRQVRGKVLRELLEGPNLVSRLAAYVGDSRLHGVIDDLVAEGFVERQGDSIGNYTLKP